MVKLAIFHATLPEYLRSTSAEADQQNLEIALASADARELIKAATSTRVDALVADLALLGDQPQVALEQLERALQPELTVVVYAFAKWELIEALRGPKRQLLRAPVSARALRSNMLGLIVKHLTQAPPPTPAKAVDPALLRLEQRPPMRRFSDLQLSALQDIKSVVDCECPNQVADLVLALQAFESYSAQCQNRNEKDAQMHRLLARVTGHARAVMEYGLKELCAFEGIDVARLGQGSDRGRAA